MKKIFDRNKSINNQRDLVIKHKNRCIIIGKNLGGRRWKNNSYSEKEKEQRFSCRYESNYRDNFKDAGKCINMSLKLLYNELDMQQNFEFNNISKRFHNVINKPFVVRLMKK